MELIRWPVMDRERTGNSVRETACFILPDLAVMELQDRFSGFIWIRERQALCFFISSARAAWHRSSIRMRRTTRPRRYGFLKILMAVISWSLICTARTSRSNMWIILSCTLTVPNRKHPRTPLITGLWCLQRFLLGQLRQATSIIGKSSLMGRSSPSSRFMMMSFPCR